MRQLCPPYVFLYSYEFVIWPDCFVGHSCPGGICPESGPLSLTCSITTTLGTLLAIENSICVSITIYGVVCVQLVHFSIGDWKDISIARVIIIIKSEVSTFPVVIIFFRGCVPEMFVTPYSVTYCIYVPRKPGICFHCYCAVYDECKYSDTFWLVDRTRLLVQYTISLLPRVEAFDLGLAVSVPLPIVTGIFVLLWFQSRLT